MDKTKKKLIDVLKIKLIFFINVLVQESASKIEDADKQQVEASIKELKSKMESDDEDAITQATENLTKDFQEISKKLYQSTDSAGKFLWLKPNEESKNDNKDGAEDVNYENVDKK